MKANENELIGKKIRILFEDLENKSNSKIGICISENDRFIQIKKINNFIEFIPISKVIRIEVLSENAV